eukprot:TRINITY_DN5620_c0_g1_i11.p1 TRINITY_DN5620_c0_g1~~TRINITY_DN5620_c0_g1_i11.p1  ORF type:complete len:207 (+),score=29.34 TRINITY_DN5620_c0_g1_i11:157-777(+)
MHREEATSPAILALCKLGNWMKDSRKKWIPINIAAREEHGVQHFDLVLNMPCIRNDSFKLSCLSDKLSPRQVTQRVAIWVDLALGFGLLHPPTAYVGLAYVMTEAFVYRRAKQDLGLRFREEDRVAELPTTMLMFWFIMTDILAALHFGSVALPPMHAMALMAVAWLLAFWTPCGRRPEDDALELADITPATRQETAASSYADNST